MFSVIDEKYKAGIYLKLAEAYLLAKDWQNAEKAVNRVPALEKEDPLQKRYRVCRCGSVSSRVDLHRSALQTFLISRASTKTLFATFSSSLALAMITRCTYVTD